MEKRSVRVKGHECAAPKAGVKAQGREAALQPSSVGYRCRAVAYSLLVARMMVEHAATRARVVCAGQQREVRVKCRQQSIASGRRSKVVKCGRGVGEGA